MQEKIQSTPIIVYTTSDDKSIAETAESQAEKDGIKLAKALAEIERLRAERND